MKEIKAQWGLLVCLIYIKFMMIFKKKEIMSKIPLYRTVITNAMDKSKRCTILNNKLNDITIYLMEQNHKKFMKKKL